MPVPFAAVVTGLLEGTVTDYPQVEMKTLQHIATLSALNP